MASSNVIREIAPGKHPGESNRVALHLVREIEQLRECLDRQVEIGGEVPGRLYAAGDGRSH
jgi:hypothetical protein